ncbi:MAG: cytochrome c biogenesis protein CcdA [Solirubrobacteraceae bacterium]|nr:cytochrome c biogenesis protein CcdA [Solirubrobacteraceae bacterium]
MAAIDPTVFTAFAAGMLSFASPCVLPLVPGYLSVLGGGEGLRPTGERGRGAILGPALLFCLAFVLVFVALGMFASGIGAPLLGSIRTIEVVSGAVLMAMGALFVLTPFVSRINVTIRPTALLERAGAGSPLLAGLAFAVAWTPCTGPILGAILGAAATQSGVGGGAFLLLAYGLGLAVPFLVSAIAFERIVGAARVIRDHYHGISIASGALLIVVGWLVANHEMYRLAAETRGAIDDLGLGGVVRFFER